MTYPTGIKSSNLSNSGNIHLPTSSPPAAHAAAPQLSSRALSADKVWAPTVPGSMINFIKLVSSFPAAAQRTTRQQEAVTASSPTSGQARSSTATSMPNTGEKTNTERPTNKRQWHELGSASTAAPAKRSRLGTPDEPSMVASQPSLTKHSVNSSVGPAIPHIGIAMASLTNSLVALASTEKNPQSPQASSHSAPLPGPQNFQLELSADNVFRDVLSNFKSTGEISMENINSLINFSNTNYPLKHSRLIHLIEFVDALLSEMSAGRAPSGIFYVGALSRTVFDRFFSFSRKSGLAESKEPIRMRSVKRFLGLLHHHTMLLDAFEAHIKEPKNIRLTSHCGITTSFKILQKLRECKLRLSDTELEQMISLKRDNSGIPSEAWRMILAKNHRDPLPQAEGFQPGFISANGVSRISADRLRELKIGMPDTENSQKTSIQSKSQSNPMEARKPGLGKTHHDPLTHTPQIPPRSLGVISATSTFERPCLQKTMESMQTGSLEESHYSSIRTNEAAITKDGSSRLDIFNEWLSSPMAAIRSTEQNEIWNDQESYFPDEMSDRLVAAGASVTTMENIRSHWEPETRSAICAPQTPYTQDFNVDAFWNE